jgi:probable rRNA maturation factor
MIKVNIAKQSSFPVNTRKLKKDLRDFLEKRGIVSDTEINLSLVGEKKMLEIGKSYLKEMDKPAHNVLSFPSVETKEAFVFPPDGKIHLGEIVVCFPKAVEEAKREGKLIDEKVDELVKHGALHLLGIHHK